MLGFHGLYITASDSFYTFFVPTESYNYNQIYHDHANENALLSLQIQLRDCPLDNVQTYDNVDNHTRYLNSD